MQKIDIDLRNFENELIIHYGVENHEINAKTLAHSLISLSNAIKRTDSLINPGFEVEIIVESIDVGSFKISTKKIYSELSNIFSRKDIKTIALSLVAAFIWDCFEPDKEINVTVNTDEYVIEKGDEKIILPKDAGKYYDTIKKDKNIRKEISDTFKILDSDKKIENVGFTENKKEIKEPDFVVPREFFSKLSALVELEEEKTEKLERCKITILRAILEKSLRRWQFIWNGIKISAPILDVDFYSDFMAHKYTIAPGDALEVELRIIMKKDEETGLYINSEYEVLKVYDIIESPKQTSFET